MHPQPPRAFSIRGLRLYFPALEPWVARSALLPAVCPVYLCANVGLQGLLVVRLPAPFIPHSASLGPAMATRVLSAPVPVSAPPTSLYECLFFISLVWDILAIRFSVNSGCVRRRSVSTYGAILVLLTLLIWIFMCSFSERKSCLSGCLLSIPLNRLG